MADKAYDAEWVRKQIEGRDAVPIIPDRRGTKNIHVFSKLLYRARNRIERCFNKLKQFRLTPPATKSSLQTSSP